MDQNSCRITFKGRHFTKEIILTAVRWKLSYPLSYRNIEEMMNERNVSVDHSTIQKWVVKYAPQLESEFRKRKKPVGGSWRMDETYIKVNGKQTYLYRAVDKSGKTIDFMLSKKRNRKAAMAFFEKAIVSSGLPDKVNIDKSGANTAALERINTLLFMSGLWFLMLEVRRVKYLNNMIEQDHRAIKCVTKQMRGFKSFDAAEATLAGIELCHMLKKDQMLGSNLMPSWKQFYTLAD